MEQFNLFYTRYRYLFLSLIITAAGIICYTNTLKNQFLWDDESIIINNPHIKDINRENIKKIFSTRIFGDQKRTLKFYRPLHALSYSVDYLFWKLNPTGYHLTSIFLHILNSLLIFLLLLSLKLPVQAGFFVSLIFCIHPVNTEAVTFISARGDLLHTLFSLSCLFFFSREDYRKQPLFNLLAALSFAAALLSKETALVLPFILLSYSLIFKKRRSLSWYLLMLFMLAAVATYLTVEITFSRTSPFKTLSPIALASFRERLCTLPRIIFTYFRLALLPYNLHMEYLFVEKKLLTPYTLMGLPLLAAFFYTSLRFIKPRGKTLFFFLWLILGLAPFTNILLPLPATLREHWLYFPGIGFLVISVTGFFTVFTRAKNKYLKYIMLSLAYVLGIYFIYYTVVRNAQWRTPLTLYEHDVKYEPRSHLLHTAMGNAYLDQNKLPRAKASLRRALQTETGENYGNAYNTLGLVYIKEKNREKALQCFKAGTAVSKYKPAYVNLANIYIHLDKDFPKAVETLIEALLYHPSDPDLLTMLGYSHFSLKDYRAALPVYKKLAELRPYDTETKKIISYILSRQKN